MPAEIHFDTGSSEISDGIARRSWRTDIESWHLNRPNERSFRLIKFFCHHCHPFQTPGRNTRLLWLCCGVYFVVFRNIIQRIIIVIPIIQPFIINAILIRLAGRTLQQNNPRRISTPLPLWVCKRIHQITLVKMPRLLLLLFLRRLQVPLHIKPWIFPVNHVTQLHGTKSIPDVKPQQILLGNQHQFLHLDLERIPPVQPLHGRDIIVNHRRCHAHIPVLLLHHHAVNGEQLPPGIVRFHGFFREGRGARGANVADDGSPDGGLDAGGTSSVGDGGLGARGAHG
mmetsp:Transcript_29686/g.59144  ORF Transcript_29686/g.59144 Transcript_29686/m.59144 type:complete len:284 (+) Transcript_29686:1010-1861(+)